MTRRRSMSTCEILSTLSLSESPLYANGWRSWSKAVHTIHGRTWRLGHVEAAH